MYVKIDNLYLIIVISCLNRQVTNRHFNTHIHSHTPPSILHTLISTHAIDLTVSSSLPFQRPKYTSIRLNIVQHTHIYPNTSTSIFPTYIPILNTSIHFDMSQRTLIISNTSPSIRQSFIHF